VNFQLGDIVEIYSPIAGKTKYHLFVVKMSDFGVSLFFFFNSKPGYDAEISICPDDASGLPGLVQRLVEDAGKAQART
jgi:hypothetical protein